MPECRAAAGAWPSSGWPAEDRLPKGFARDILHGASVALWWFCGLCVRRARGGCFLGVEFEGRVKGVLSGEGGAFFGALRRARQRLLH